MKSCENCIHLEVCAYTMRDQEGNLIPCDDFLDQYKFVYAPFNVDDTAYVVTQYSYNSSYEVVKCRVTKTNLKKDRNFLITCQGEYAKGSRYSGSLSSKSINKTIFDNFEDAEKKCKKLNEKRA